MEQNICHILTICFYPFQLKKEGSIRGAGLVEIELSDNKGEIRKKECFITEDAEIAGAYIKESYIDDHHFQWKEKEWKRKREGIVLVFSERNGFYNSLINCVENSEQAYNRIDKIQEGNKNG